MTNQIPKWLANWFGLSTEDVAQTAIWQLESGWTWPPWVTVLLILGAIVLVVAIYAREATGAGRGYRTLLVGLRLIALGIVLMMIAQWALVVRFVGPPSLALVIDQSASMGIVDHNTQNGLPEQFQRQIKAAGLNEATRLNLAKHLVTMQNAHMLRKLAARYRLHLYLVDDQVERVSSSADPETLMREITALTAEGPNRKATRLGDAIRQILGDAERPAAIVLFTDGVTTSGVPLAAAVEEARRKGVPVFSIGIGDTHGPRDIEVADVLVDDAVFVNDLVNLQVHIRANGLEGELATVRLRVEGEPSSVGEQEITLPATGQTLTVPLLHRPTKPGELKYTVEVAPREVETTLENNIKHRVVEVRDDKIRVLLVFGYPSYEFRFLKTLLERDPMLELSTYLQDADPDYADQDRTALRSFPVRRDDLLHYDVLIFGDVDPRLVPRSAWQSLRAFVAEHGRGIALLAGPRFFPWMYHDINEMRAVLPIELSDPVASLDAVMPPDIARGFLVRPTPLGLQNPFLQLGNTPAETERIWNNLPPLFWLFEVESLKPAAQVLAQAATSEQSTKQPVACLQYVGPGRVLFHAIDSTWRWRQGAGEIYFARYWVQAVRFLARNMLESDREMQLSTDRREYRHGETITLRARFNDTSLAAGGGDVAVAVETPGQPRRRVMLHRNPALEHTFEASITDLAAGQFEATLLEPKLPGSFVRVRFTVAAPLGEFARPEMDAAALQSAAELTNGRFYTLSDADRLIEELPAGRRVPIRNSPPISLWNQWWVLAAFVITITSEWILRKRKGML